MGNLHFFLTVLKATSRGVTLEHRLTAVSVETRTTICRDILDRGLV